MADNYNLSSMTIAPGVVDRVVAIAAEEVEGVSSVGSYVSGGLLSRLASRAKREAILTEVDESGKLNVKIHLNMVYGYSIPKVAAEVRQSVADALLLQAGIEVGNVDIMVESVTFKKNS